MIIPLPFLAVFSILSLIAIVFFLWTFFEKNGQKNWYSLIPGLNIYIWLKILEKPVWWFILYFVPFLNFFMLQVSVWETIRGYGKTQYRHLLLGTLFPIFMMPYLALAKQEKFTRLNDLPKRKKTVIQEWVDALLFAVAAAYIIRSFLIEFYIIPTSSMESSLMVGDFLAVSKIHYGPKLPQTPIAVPFVHHTLPLTQFTKSYVEWIKFPYFRFSGLQEVNRYDAVVFNYADGDTVALEAQNMSYYQLVREYEKAQEQNLGPHYRPGMGWQFVQDNFTVVSRPIDKRENYIKRCVALPGDKLEIRNGELFINDQAAMVPKNIQYQYVVYTNGFDINPKWRQTIHINEEDRFSILEYVKYSPERTMDENMILKIIDSLKTNPNIYIYALNSDMIEAMKSLPNVTGIERLVASDTVRDPNVFPHHSSYVWNRDNFGPIIIPKENSTVKLDTLSLPLYKAIIETYEGNKLEVKGDKIYINGELASSYTFKMNYYWMMGDNRHNSADSRYWGFIPEDHIAGKALFVWLSLDKFKKWTEGKIRWRRMFRSVK
jgi:signal peptidase I